MPACGRRSDARRTTLFEAAPVFPAASNAATAYVTGPVFAYELKLRSVKVVPAVRAITTPFR